VPQTINTNKNSGLVYSENLVEIKNIFYVEQPLLLLVSVVGLLVALFGVTAVINEKK
jgi:hypothetical protein